MSQDPVFNALHAALMVQDSVEIRHALGTHLLSKGQHAEALAQFEAGLVLEPQHILLLQGAVDAAQATGAVAKKTAYQLSLQVHTGIHERPKKEEAVSLVSPHETVAV